MSLKELKNTLGGHEVHTFNSSTQLTEAGRPLISRATWFTERVAGQPGVGIEINHQNQKAVEMYLCVRAMIQLQQAE